MYVRKAFTLGASNTGAKRRSSLSAVIRHVTLMVQVYNPSKRGDEASERWGLQPHRSTSRGGWVSWRITSERKGSYGREMGNLVLRLASVNNIVFRQAQKTFGGPVAVHMYFAGSKLVNIRLALSRGMKGCVRCNVPMARTSSCRVTVLSMGFRHHGKGPSRAARQGPSK